MDKIVRKIEREKGDRILTYNFTTYPVIFDRSTRFLDQNKDRPNLILLLDFLAEAFVHGMQERRKSPSESPEKLIETTHVTGHPLSKYAAKSGYMGMGNRQHPIAQNYLLDHCPEAIAIEVPVWEGEEEDENAESGCIDVILYYPENDHVGVWDLKPKAAAERTASAQVHDYVRLFMQRSCISRSSIIAGYFDDKDCYVLPPY